MRKKWITRKLKENGGNKRSPIIEGLHQNVHLSLSREPAVLANFWREVT
jgi:hypothetical protein